MAAIEYPGREGLAKDVAFALVSARRSDMNEITVRHVLKVACWWTSNRAGKGDNCPYWSVKALERRAKWQTPTWQSDHQLIHEHIVPRKCIETELLHFLDPAQPPPTWTQVDSILSLSEVCVIAACEDKKFSQPPHHLKQRMPVGWSSLGDKWARYDAVGIELASLDLVREVTEPYRRLNARTR